MFITELNTALAVNLQLVTKVWRVLSGSMWRSLSTIPGSRGNFQLPEVEVPIMTSHSSVLTVAMEDMISISCLIKYILELAN
ncbi:hypothetical protein [Pantoea sp. Nvir]|uniref:hypothetical protein n=1 Tax=Pantoea sp. Nvir TaxID=2576760 RepID=UPI001357A1DF|nr:hypothetical protein [Pantoea sp. Nvir]